MDTNMVLIICFSFFFFIQEFRLSKLLFRRFFFLSVYSFDYAEFVVSISRFKCEYPQPIFSHIIVILLFYTYTYIRHLNGWKRKNEKTKIKRTYTDEKRQRLNNIYTTEFLLVLCGLSRCMKYHNVCPKLHVCTL